MGHTQSPTHVKTDNKIVNSFVHMPMHVKCSKTWDMMSHWLWEASTRKSLNIFWGRGSNNNADYFSNHHPSAHHLVQQKHYILKGFNTSQ
eukprot:727873-Ditylum_brightwellii.AAC.1